MLRRQTSLRFEDELIVEDGEQRNIVSNCVSDTTLTLLSAEYLSTTTNPQLRETFEEENLARGKIGKDKKLFGHNGGCL